MKVEKQTISGIESVLSEYGKEHLMELAYDKRYSLYLKVPRQLRYFLDKCNINYESDKVTGYVGLYYIWLKTVDDEMDKNIRDAKEYLFSITHNEPIGSDVDELTEIIFDITKPRHENFIDQLQLLYYSSRLTKKSTNINELIRRRSKEGYHTSKSTCALILPYTNSDIQKFENIFCKLGQMATVFDTLMDIDKDQTNGEFNFKLKFKDKLKLIEHITKENLKLISEYPFIYRKIIKTTIKFPLYARNDSAIQKTKQ